MVFFSSRLTNIFIFVELANTVFSYALCFLENIFSFTQDAFSISVIVDTVGDENWFFDWQNQRKVEFLAKVGRNMDFILFAVGPVVALALSTHFIPVVTRLAFNACVVYLLQTVSDEFLRATFTFVRILYIPFLTFYALVVFLVLAILNFGDAEGMLIESG